MEFNFLKGWNLGRKRKVIRIQSSFFPFLISAALGFLCYLVILVEAGRPYQSWTTKVSGLLPWRCQPFRLEETLISPIWVRGSPLIRSLMARAHGSLHINMALVNSILKTRGLEMEKIERVEVLQEESLWPGRHIYYTICPGTIFEQCLFSSSLWVVFSTLLDDSFTPHLQWQVNRVQLLKDTHMTKMAVLTNVQVITI